MKHPIYDNYSVDSEGTITGPRKKLNPCIHHTGYATITLRKEGNQKQYRAHRFIWEARNNQLIPEGLQINHKDGNKINNHPDNLELCTAKENCEHRETLCLSSPRRGEDNGMAKLSTYEAIDLINKIKQGLTNTELGTMFNLHPRYVSLVRHRRRWKKLWELLESSETISTSKQMEAVGST